MSDFPFFIIPMFMAYSCGPGTIVGLYMFLVTLLFHNDPGACAGWLISAIPIIGPTCALLLPPLGTIATETMDEYEAEAARFATHCPG